MTRLSVFKDVVNPVQIVKMIQYIRLSRKIVSFVVCSNRYTKVSNMDSIVRPVSKEKTYEVMSVL